MTSIGWKRFKFFDEERHTGAPFPDGVTTACAGLDDDVWLACADGLVVCMDKELAIKSTFPAFKGTVHYLNVSKGRLVALGEEAEGFKSLTLKVWDIATLRSGTTPPVLTARKLFAASKLPEGTLQTAAAYVDEWPAISVALGTSTSAVHVYKGDAVKGKLMPAPFGCRVLRGGGGGGGSAAAASNINTNSPQASGVTALHFAGSGNSLHLFALTVGSLTAISLATGQALLEDDCGAAPGCSARTNNGELLVAGPDAVYFYTAEEGRKAAVAIKGDKHAVVAFRQYIAAAVPDDSVSATSTTNNTTSSSTTSNGTNSSTVLRIFDPSNKVVAATTTIHPPLKWIITGSHGILTADSSGAAIRFWEKPLEQRLESLFRSRSFQLALRIAQMENAGAKVVAEVRRFFGDFLYSKRDYDAAAVQYAGTVGVLEPSYVIQKFLDAQRVHNLTTYLEAVHEKGIATADHTTLLLNCYTKLRDVSKIDKFVQQANIPRAQNGSTAGAPVLPFDAPAAIAVLHSAGYNEHAVFVALAAGRTDDYLSILLEDCQRIDEGLNYIKSLGRRRAAAALHKFGKLLLDGDSVGTTALLMELCLPAASTPSQQEKEEEKRDAQFVANLTDFTHLYTERPDDLQYACVTILAMGHPDLPSKQTLYHTLLDLYLCSSTPNSINNKNKSNGANGARATGATSSTSSNRNTGPSGSGFTRSGASSLPGSMPAGHAEALDLLKRGWPPGQDPAYDIDRALTTCRLHEFHQGLVFLYTNRRDYREAAAVLADARDWTALLEICQVHGSATTGGDPEIWHDALERLSSPASASPGVDAALRELLSRIEADAVMPPMAVLPVLAKNPHLRLDLIRDYVIRALEAENRAIAADVEEAQRLKEEVLKAEAAVKKLTTEPVIFQSSRDSQTGAPLELPSVHFLCGHSFNLRTLGDGVEGQECPLCAAEHRKVRELQQSHRAAAGDTDAFFRQLKAAPDGFGLVAEYFGKGLLNNTSVSTRE